jgi:hypothetical protein
MSWNDFYRRRDILDAVLDAAREDPTAPLPFAAVPGAQETFGTEQALLLALHYRWSLFLGGYLRAEIGGTGEIDDEDTGTAVDHVDEVTRAWQAAVRDQETLRAVLDAGAVCHPQALRAVQEAEYRMLALTAGLAEPHEPTAEITQVGATFEALLRNGPTLANRRRSPVGQLLRLLSPSA